MHASPTVASVKYSNGGRQELVCSILVSKVNISYIMPKGSVQVMQQS